MKFLRQRNKIIERAMHFDALYGLGKFNKEWKDRLEI